MADPILLKPKKVSIKSLDGVDCNFTIHRLPATLGREIAYQYLPANMPKVGDYAKSKELSDKMLAYVCADINGDLVPLVGDDLINNHCHDWEVMSKLEDVMLDYNTSFLADGKGSIFSRIFERSMTLLGTVILTDSSEQS